MLPAILALGCHGFEPLEASHSGEDRASAAEGQTPEAVFPSHLVSEGTSSDAARQSTLSRSELLARWNAVRGDGYELDSVDRYIAPSGSRRVQCSPEGMVLYRGNAVRYQSPVTVNPAFRERLRRFEDAVAEVSVEIYGRAPRRIQHYGAYSCRASRNRSYRLSEHALGNAIDVAGFDFGPADKKAPVLAGQPKRLRAPFVVKVARHWGKSGDVVAETHARFLRALTDRLRERDVFRGFVGPGHPGHDDHLHFDVAPWRYVRL